MEYFITSDTHFCHANIIKYCKRPFYNVADMDAALINNWNKTVGKDDIVFHLGDVAFTKDFDKLKEIINSLNGKIILILGNHDNYFTPIDFIDAGISEVYPYYECNLLDAFWVFSHYQMVTWNRSCHGSFHCFGHEHWLKQPKINYTLFEENHWSERKYNVCVDANNYKPINLKKVQSILSNYHTNFQNN